MNSNPCEALRREIWSLWPQDLLPAQALSHAETCPGCRAEIESFRKLCRSCLTQEGSPLLWSVALPASRMTRLAAATRAAIVPEPSGRRPLVWAAAALAVALFAVWRRPSRPVLPVPIEVVEDGEFYEQLSLFENWDTAQKLPPVLELQR